jgi:hypothetical protein
MHDNCYSRRADAQHFTMHHLHLEQNCFQLLLELMRYDAFRVTSYCHMTPHDEEFAMLMEINHECTKTIVLSRTRSP